MKWLRKNQLRTWWHKSWMQRNFFCVTLTRPFALLSILEVYNLRNLRSNVYCEDVLVTLIQVNADKKHIP